MYKLGKTPARPDAVKFKLTDYISLPIPPPKYGHQTIALDWGMLGNDQYGDCVWAGADHETMLWNKEAMNDVLFNPQNALADYTAVTGFNPNDPNTDQGTDMSVAASYRRKTGVVDKNGQRHKIGAYLKITPANIMQLKQAIYLFSNVGVGFEFPSYAMSQFDKGQTWHLQSSSKIVGGHYVPTIGYDSQYLYVITWGKVQKMSWGFFKKYCDEALVYLSLEFLSNGESPTGFNLTQLQSDLASLT